MHTFQKEINWLKDKCYAEFQDGSISGYFLDDRYHKWKILYLKHHWFVIEYIDTLESTLINYIYMSDYCIDNSDVDDSLYKAIRFVVNYILSCKEYDGDI